MGTYRQPASLVDIQSGKMARQAIERGFKGLEKIAEASIKQAEKRAKQEEEYKKAEKDIWEKSAVMLAKGNSLVDKNRIDGASLGTGVKMVTDDIAKARIENLRLSTNDPGYQENLAVIGNGMQFLEGLNSTLEGGVYYEQTVQDAIQNGVGYAPGQIAPGSATAEWLEANSQTEKIDMGWDFSFEVRKEDDGAYKLYNIGKKDESTIVNPIQAMSKDDEDITTINYGAFRINPDPSKDTKDILIEQGVLSRDGAISDRYTTTEQKVIGGKVYNVTTNNLEELTDVSNSAADVTAEEIISNGGESMVDAVRMFGTKDPDNQNSKAFGYAFPEVDENGNYVRNSDGTIKIGKWRQITDDNGEIVQDASFPSETGRVEPEQYDLFMQMIRARTAADNGLFAPERREFDDVATRAYQKRIEKDGTRKLTEAERGALYKKRIIDENLDAAIEALDKDPSQVTLAGLNNLKSGYSFEIPMRSRPNEIILYGKETAAGGQRSIIMEIDLSTEEGQDKARQNLYSEFGVKSIVDQEKPTFKEGAKEEFEKNKLFLDVIDELEYKLFEKDGGDFKITTNEEDVTDLISKTKINGKTIEDILKEKGIKVNEEVVGSDVIEIVELSKDEEGGEKEKTIKTFDLNGDKDNWKDNFLKTLEDMLLTKSPKKEVEISNLAKGL